MRHDLKRKDVVKLNTSGVRDKDTKSNKMLDTILIHIMLTFGKELKKKDMFVHRCCCS